MTPVALTVAGSDPCGGAGIQADLKTFQRFGVYGEAVITLLTVQNSMSVSRVEVVDPELVLQQLQAVLNDIPPGAAKYGALGNLAVIEALARASFPCPLVIDPVMVSKHGSSLLARDAESAFRSMLVPRADLITPNLPEAAVLTGLRVESLAEMRDAAHKLSDMGARAVLVKGGHLTGDATDMLYEKGEFTEFPAPRHATLHTHGTGCTYSAAITAELAKGKPLLDAVASAKTFITEAIRTAPGLGHGNGPVNHLA